MKRLIILFSFVLILSSCITNRQIKRNCDKFAQICVTDTETVVEYRDTIIYRHDTIKIQLPADTVKLTDTVTISEGVAYMPPVEKYFGSVGVRAWINNSRLNAWGWLRDSTILEPVHDTIILDNIFEQTTTTKYIELPPEKYLPWWAKITFWGFWLLALITGWKIIRFPLLKFLLPR